MNYKEIQNDIILKINVNVDENGCPFGCRMRTHAHVRERQVCKCKLKNSIKSTFTLFHEIGHIETTTSKMRRCESEYYATLWAIDELKKYGVEVPDNIIKTYQEYINRELDRGIRRGGKNYPKELNLYDKK